MSDSFGRIRKEAAEDVRADAERRLVHSGKGSPLQLWVHKAHVVMLAESGILQGDEAVKIFRALEALGEKQKEDPNLSVYMNSESFVISQAGDVGGKMHIGRSRNDLDATVLRMLVRQQINLLASEVIDFSKALLQKADVNVDAVMPGYTHWQHAQPITFAHYLLAHVQASCRTIDRLENAYEMTNLNPLGAAALAGTGWSIDRNRTTELLGFSALLENTQDCVASRDFEADIGFALAVHLSNLSRLATDLQTWMTFEYGMVELDESYASTSSIMPQKKNSTTLELVKGRAAATIGALVNILTAMKSIEYSNVVDHREAIHALTSATEDDVFATRFMKGIVSTLILNKTRMLENAAEGFGTMTELADLIVRARSLSFREAHEIVAQVVTQAIAKSMKPSQITSQMVDEAAQAVIGRKVGLNATDIMRATDPVENVKVRRVQGGPAPEAVRQSLQRYWQTILQAEERLVKRKEYLDEAKRKTEDAIKLLLKENPT